VSRPLRYVPEGGSLVEVTCRTIQARFLLLPTPQLTQIVIGILARAKRRYPVEVCAAVFLSNHYHLLLWVPDAHRLAQFMRYVNSNLAREAADLFDWPDKIFARRYHAAIISNEEAAQVGRLEYLLAHGVKEGLVAQLRDWPGVHSVKALLDGEPLVGLWFDRTKEYAARQRGKSFQPLEYATEETLELDPLPCWRHLTPEQIRRNVAELVGRIEADAAAERERTGTVPLGPIVIRNQHPHDHPKKPKKSPAPMFHAFTKRVRKELQEAYREFVKAFREASEELLRKGNRLAAFPIGCFPPGLPFVGVAAGRSP
jgi:REP element-mobilizing transposase RayT